MVVLILVVTCLHSRIKTLQKFVCPLLTILNFAYLSFLDYDYTLGSIYYS
jgi:hypothetical protein